MSILHMDGFAHYGAVNDQLFGRDGGAYSNVLNDADVKIVTMPVLGGLGIQMVSHAPSTFAFTKDLLTGHNTGSLGVAFHFYMATPGNSHDRLLLTLSDAAGVTRYQIFLQASGLISIFDGSFFQSAPGNIAYNTLYYFEFKIIFAGSGAGSVEIKLNGASWVIKSGVTTNSNSLRLIRFMDLYSGTTGWPVQMTNLVIWDNAGAANNNYMGEQFVYTLFPDTDTADADWTLSTGTDGFALLDNVPPVDVSSYIEANNVGDVSIFDLDDLPTLALVIAATMTVVRAERTGAVGGTLDMGPGEGGVFGLTGVAPVNGTYNNHQAINELNPNTGVAWLSPEINNAQIQLSRTL